MVLDLKENCKTTLESKTVDRAYAISTFFIKIGLYANLKGFDYLIGAVEEVLKDSRMMHSLTKELYPKLAERFQTSVGSVERGIRNAIDIACNRGKLYSVANVYYGGNFSKNDRPTNGEFISFLVTIVQDI